MEWGGSGETILFLSGAGAPAYAFDDFAPLFTDAYRAVGVTRRGVPPSDPSLSGYSPGTLTADVLAVMDSLGIRMAHLVGWSFGGIEAVLLAAAHPERVKSLTLLDSYDASAEAGYAFNVPELSPAPFTSFDSSSALALAWRQRRLGQTPLPLTAICAVNRFSPEGRFQRRGTPPGYADTLVGGLTRLPYQRITRPTLALFAITRGVGDLYPRYPTMGPADRLTADSVTAGHIRSTAAFRDQIRREIPHLTIIEVPGAAHAIFVSHSAIAYVAMRKFLEANSPAR